MSEQKPDLFAGYRWTPPRPGEVEIKYSKISEKHKLYLESRKKGRKYDKANKTKKAR